MATLLINDVAEQELAELQALASADRMTVEDELRLAYRQYLKARGAGFESAPKIKAKAEVPEPSTNVDWENLPLIEDKDDLLRAVEAFHKDMGREVNLSPEELKAAITEGRE